MLTVSVPAKKGLVTKKDRRAFSSALWQVSVVSCVESYRGLASPQYECKNGDTYRGFLDETEDNMNCILKDATRTDAKHAWRTT